MDVTDQFPSHLKGFTMHSMPEVKHSIEEPRSLLFMTQTPRTGEDELQSEQTG